MTTRSDQQPTWPEVPQIPPRPSRSLHRGWIEAACAALAAVGPTLRASVVPDGAPWLVLALIALASAAIGALHSMRNPARLLPVVAVAVVLLPLQGSLVAGWAALGLILVDWTLRGHPPHPLVPAPTPSVAAPVAIVLLLLAAVRGYDTNLSFGPVVPLALAVMLAMLASFRGDQMTRVAAAVGHGAASAVGVVCFAILGVFVVVIPWIGHRILRVDPLYRGGGAESTWLRRSLRDPSPTEPWSAEPVVDGRSFAYRFRRAIATPLVVLVAAVAIWAIRPDPSQRASPLATAPGVFAADPSDQPESSDGSDSDSTDVAANPEPSSSVHEGEDWYPAYSKAIGWILADDDVWTPLRLQRIRDVSSPYVNVVDGDRTSWTAPPCSCRRLTVWMYGGSTTFGLGQRDEHTIASEIARAAAADGMALDVINKGQPGQGHLLEAQRFGWDIAEGPAPDLVIFYDGANEIWTAEVLEGTTGVDEPVDPLTLEFERGVGERFPQDYDKPDDVELADEQPKRNPSADAFGTLVMERYERARQMSADIAAANNIPVVWMWQPSRFSSPSQALGSGDDEPEWVARYRSTEAKIPSDVMDLTRVFDGTSELLFSDRIHHNERGAEIVAAEINERLRPRLQALLDGERTGS